MLTGPDLGLRALGQIPSVGRPTPPFGFAIRFIMVPSDCCAGLQKRHFQEVRTAGSKSLCAILHDERFPPFCWI